MDLASGNPTRRRVRHDIIMGILETARNGELKSHIMTKVNLSGNRLEHYLSYLLSKDFLKREGNLYKTTEKGLSIIEACRVCLRLAE